MLLAVTFVEKKGHICAVSGQKCHRKLIGNTKILNSSQNYHSSAVFTCIWSLAGNLGHKHTSLTVSISALFYAGFVDRCESVLIT